ncbi:MAG: hypothetical protein K0S65_5305, partial [Labilithrix sp.]|nr:hypothetical protein [Labilithrix sp.]
MVAAPLYERRLRAPSFFTDKLAADTAAFLAKEEPLANPTRGIGIRSKAER